MKLPAPKALVWKAGIVSAASMTGGVLNDPLPNPLLMSGTSGPLTSKVGKFGCASPLPPNPPSNRNTPANNGTSGNCCAVRVLVSKFRFLFVRSKLAPPLKWQALQRPRIGSMYAFRPSWAA